MLTGRLRLGSDLKRERSLYQGYAGRSVNSWPDSRESSAAAGPNRGETSAAKIS